MKLTRTPEGEGLLFDDYPIKESIVVGEEVWATP